VLWPANLSYTTFTVSSIVTEVSDDCTSGLTGSDAVIWKVTCDEAEDASGNNRNDIVIASDCRSVQLRAQRDGGSGNNNGNGHGNGNGNGNSTGNGRVYRVYVRATDDNGNTSSSDTYFTVSVPLVQNGTAVDDDVVNNEQSCGGGAKPATGEVTSGFLLMQNHPNPFGTSTTIEYIVPATSHVSLMVYDAQGSVIATIVDDEQAAGRHSAGFDGSKLASGTYAYVLRANGAVLARTMVLVR
jgi:hypothetical protein